MPYYEIQNLYKEHFETKLDILKFIDSETCSFYALILHDRDIKEDGSVKKPHYHFIVYLSSKEDIKPLMVKLHSVDNTIKHKNIRSPNAYVRYLTHKDNMDKFQYSDNDVITNDIETYKDLCYTSHKMSNTDLLLCEFITHFEELYDKGFEITQYDVMEFFKRKNKLSYYIAHNKALKETLNCLGILITNFRRE